jgi:hypothetical protein
MSMNTYKDKTRGLDDNTENFNINSQVYTKDV